MPKSLSSLRGGVFIQPGGANNPIYPIDCGDVDGIEIPREQTTPIMCKSPTGNGWEVRGKLRTVPGLPTLTINSLVSEDLAAIEGLTCEAGVYVTNGCGGPTDLLSNYTRMYIMRDAIPSNFSYAALTSHETDTPSTMSAAFTGSGVDIAQKPINIARRVTTEAGAANDVSFNPDYLCADNGCGTKINVGDTVLVSADAVGAATPDNLISYDAGETYAILTPDPAFPVSRNAMANTMFSISGSARRWLVAAEGTGAAVQGLVAFSDDLGATWTLGNVGGAAVAHGATKGGGLYAYSHAQILLACNAGYIYRSTDGGATWTAVESAGVTAGAYTEVSFEPTGQYGMAVAAAGIVAKTYDGGLTWSAATPITAVPDLTTVQVIDVNRAWVGTATGLLFYTNDFGTTWLPRIGWTGSGTGAVRSLHFLNPYTGWMAHNNATPLGKVLRTLNGGLSWENITTPATIGLNRIRGIDVNTAVAVGELQAATATLLKASA